MKRLFKALAGFALIVAVMLGVALVRTWRTPPLPQPPAAAGYAPPAFDEAAALERFAGAVRLPTVSTPEGPPSKAALDAFHAYLAAQFPKVHAALKQEEVGHGALLYTWPGSDPAKPAIVLMAHQDTVPVDAETRARWHREPWSGEIADGTVWGRGALDDKASLVAILEAAELLLGEGFSPRRTIYFAFGSDEERGGKLGADAIVAQLKQRGIRVQAVLDEGGQIVNGMLPGVQGDVALIGIAEKGFLSARLSVQAPGGHSSQPPPQSAIGILSQALVRLEQHQAKARLTPVVAGMLDALAPLLPFEMRLAVRNRWLLEPVLLKGLAATPSGNALVRTTTAETVFNAGIKDNVLPTVARATVNFRILPGDSVASTLEHVRQVVDDRRVEIAADADVEEPSPVSPVDGVAYQTLRRTIAEVFPRTPMAPYLMTAATDSAHYAPVSAEQLRFVPYHLTPETIRRFHGIDEGIPAADYLDCVRFARRYMENMAG